MVVMKLERCSWALFGYLNQSCFAPSVAAHA
jgi:hypothetical protein